jgi:divalent metal cation (Fe/Co/Zn/Cd) transporter
MEVYTESIKTTSYKKALYLSYFTVGYNVLEGLVSVLVGFMSGSIALVGFGLDVESFSGGVMVWRFRKAGLLSDKEHERREVVAIKFVAYSFFLFGSYVLYESVKKLYLVEIPNPSLLGIIIAIVSIIVMPILYYQKNKVGKSLGSSSLIADSKQTLACMFLSIVLLAGLGLNYLYSIWWADPIAGLFIVAFLFKEGYSALKEEKVCSC